MRERGRLRANIGRAMAPAKVETMVGLKLFMQR
jgi:hypothetical protein